MDLRQYQEWTEDERTDIIRAAPDDYDRVTYDTMGVAKEAGELADVWAKNARGALTPEEFREDMLLELGDTLHYLARLAYDLGFTLEEVADVNVQKLTNRKLYGKGGHGKRS